MQEEPHFEHGETDGVTVSESPDFLYSCVISFKGRL